MRKTLAAALFLSLAGCHDDWWHDHYTIYYGWPSDIDGDGYADLLVGAPLDDAGAAGSDRGRVYLYAGSPYPDGVADAVWSGTEAGGQFGASVAALGDYNGDGFADFAVGAPFEAGGGTQRGRVHVFLGGYSFPAAASIVLDGAEDGGGFGWAVARAGDVDGDGRDDLLVGAPLESGGGTQRGRAYLFTHAGGTAPLRTYGGLEDRGRFGQALDTAGDFNRDGWFDVAVGAPLDDADGNTSNNNQDRGRAFLFLGGPAADNVADLILAGVETDAHFGASVAGPFDLNGDGFDDLAVGAPLDDGDGNTSDNGLDAGRVFVFFGSGALDGTADLVLAGAAGSRFGAMVARIGDLNNGGAPDLLVGAPDDDGGGAPGAQRGRAFVFFGGTFLDAVADVVLTGAEDGGHFGSSGFSGGDVNAGGARDLAVGAPDDDGDGNTTEDGLDAGRAFLFFGGPSMDGAADLVAGGGAEAGARAGAAVQ